MFVRKLPAASLALTLGIGMLGCEPPPDGAFENTKQALTSSTLWVLDPTAIAAGATVTLQSKLDSRTLDDGGLFLDFVHWGQTTNTTVNRARGKAWLPNNPGYTLVGTTTAPTRTTTNAPKFAWWDGTPSKTGNSNAGLRVNGLNKGFKITLPAQPEPNELSCTIYGQVLGTNSQGTIKFTLASSSAPAQTRVVSAGQAFSLDYQFGNDVTSNLTISWTLTRDGGGGGVVLYANKCNWWEDQPFLVTANPSTDLDQFPRFKKGNQVQIFASALSGGPFSQVEFFEDGVSVGIKTATQPWTVTRTPAPGLHYYQVQGTRSADGKKLLTGAYRVPVWISNIQQPGQDIPDSNGTGVTVNLPISGAPTGLLLADVVFRLHVTHPYVGDIRIDAIGPDGTTRVNLSNHNGASGDDYDNTRFWDKAPVSITAGTPPYNAEWGYKPQASTGPYLGKAINGTWKLNVADDAFSDVGSLNWAEVHVLPN